MSPSANLWSRVARVYDWQLVLERPALRAVVDLASPQPGEELLDVGTGTGGLLRELARRRTRPLRAVGVDSSWEMLAAAQDLPPEWELLPADARKLPFDDDSFDVATATYLLHLLDRGDRARLLEEISRVLRPKGRLATVTPALPSARLGRLLLRPVMEMAETSSGFASGLRALDPSSEIDERFTVRRVRWVNRGYPSVCVLASLDPVVPRRGAAASRQRMRRYRGASRPAGTPAQ